MLPQDRSELPARYPRERYPRPWKLLAGVSILPVYQTALLCNVHYQTQLGSGGWEKIPRRELEQLRRQRVSDAGEGAVAAVKPLSPPGGSRLVAAGVLDVRRNGALGG